MTDGEATSLWDTDRTATRPDFGLHRGRVQNRALPPLRLVRMVAGLVAGLLLVVCLSLLWSGAPVVEAKPEIPSSYVVWPPAIRLTAPIDGYYLLVIHHPTEGDTLSTIGPWQYKAGWVATIPLPDGASGTTYHVQVGQAYDELAIYETRRYQIAPHVLFFGWTPNG